MPVTVKYENIPKSEIRKKEKEKIGIAKKRATRRGKYIQKEKISMERKTKSLLKPETRHLLFNNKEDSTC